MHVYEAPEPTRILVGCRRCRYTWKEEMMMSPDMPRVNGPRMKYDYCDSCITPGEARQGGKALV